MPKGTPKYFKARDALQRTIGTPLSVTVIRDGYPSKSFVDPGRPGKYIPQDISDQETEAALSGPRKKK